MHKRSHAECLPLITAVLIRAYLLDNFLVLDAIKIQKTFFRVIGAIGFVGSWTWLLQIERGILKSDRIALYSLGFASG